MKKMLAIVALWCGAFFAMAPEVASEKSIERVVPLVELWQNKAVDSEIKEYFKEYFVEGKGDRFNSKIGYIIRDEIYSKLSLNMKAAVFRARLSKLVDEFIDNVTLKSKIDRGADKSKYKEIDAFNKAIDVHNKEVHKNKSEIKKLLQSKPYPLDTLGGLAALLYEYSDGPKDKDNSLKLFKRHIALRNNGYFKEYFLYDVIDDEKTSKTPRYFYQIKTHRPKSWSSLVGLGNDYIDKRGWLSYAFGKLKYPVLVGGAVLAYRNREAIGKKFDESGIRESAFGQWTGKQYNALTGSKAGQWVGQKYGEAGKYLGDLYDQTGKSSYAQSLRNFGSAVSTKAGEAYQYGRSRLGLRKPTGRSPEALKEYQEEYEKAYAGSEEQTDKPGYAQRFKDYIGTKASEARDYFSNYYTKKREESYLKRSEDNRSKYGNIQDETEAELDKIIKSDTERKEERNRLEKDLSDELRQEYNALENAEYESNKEIADQKYYENEFEKEIAAEAKKYRRRNREEQRRLEEEKQFVQSQRDNNEMALEMEKDLEKIVDSEIRREQRRASEEKRRLKEEKRSIQRQKDNQEMTKEMDKDMQKILDREIRLENQKAAAEKKRLKEEKRMIRNERDNKEMAVEMDRDMEKILNREIRLEKQKEREEQEKMNLQQEASMPSVMMQEEAPTEEIEVEKPTEEPTDLAKSQSEAYIQKKTEQLEEVKKNLQAHGFRPEYIEQQMLQHSASYDKFEALQNLFRDDKISPEDYYKAKDELGKEIEELFGREGRSFRNKYILEQQALDREEKEKLARNEFNKEREEGERKKQEAIKRANKRLNKSRFANISKGNPRNL